jgi:hypothetical protein
MNFCLFHVLNHCLWLVLLPQPLRLSVALLLELLWGLWEHFYSL